MKIGKDKIDISLKAKVVYLLGIMVIYALLLLIIDTVLGQRSSMISYAIQSVVFSVVWFFVFIYAINKFGKKVDNSIKIDLAEDEVLEAEGVANIFRGSEAVGGKLFLTNQHLVFISHKYNIQSGITKLPLESIVSIDKCKTMGFIDNGLLVRTKTGSELKFVVNERNTWLEVLTQKLVLS